MFAKLKRIALIWGFIGGLIAAPLFYLHQADAGLKAVSSSGSSYNPAAVAITGGTISGVTISQSNVPTVLAQWGVPVGLASSGTMGNNGAVSGMTALPTIYAGGIWLYYPAGAIEAGSAAGFYWTVMSSTTAGTVYNSTWDGASIPAVGTTTAFATTGPGAFTGIATGEIVAATVTIAAGALGANGFFDTHVPISINTAAGNKFVRVKGGATTLATSSLATNGTPSLELRTINKGVTGSQSTRIMSGTSAAYVAAQSFSSLDSTAAIAVTITLEKATATNHVILEGGVISLGYGA